ncbi:uncharacterized protein LOC116501416 isoform X1 [Aythya fuligula]|uniref:Immediate early response 3-interacting protein 1 n=1 Tax=Aythya fuligula TaxID=219594 RepID=A0A6J3ELS8_AYTFU|nr:uncharacterized protein LOC116501416 isoform X1 [Aythya fuligula]XP_032062855.1 uncharacterized protein LOC116501416 isoform X1 [Aythya fuligula]XP_032062856.1 uncharacterized protein LOC116501416 isoform X1 [Aythya fuligula]XP_032062857.1 uncharacterized protein LOC116501416 isoform X1 [Aythya fuligula]
MAAASSARNFASQDMREDLGTSVGRTVPGHRDQNQGAECLDPSHQSEKGTQDPMEHYSVGWASDQGIGGFGDAPGIKAQLMNLVQSVRTVMRVPLIAVNSITIVLLLLFG